MDLKVKWNVEDEISKLVNEPSSIVSKVVNLLKQDNTVPFIARYRQEMTKGMSAEKIRNIKENMEEFIKIEKKAINAVKLVMKSDKPDPALEQSILLCIDEEVIDEMVAPYKPSKKPSKLQESHSLGMEEHARGILTGDSVNLHYLVNKNIESLKSTEAVTEVLILLIAEIISNDPDWLASLSKQCFFSGDVCVTSKQVLSKKIPDKVDISTFKEYFDFRMPINRIKPYKYLALQRGKSLKVLKTDIDVPDRIKIHFIQQLKLKYCPNNRNNNNDFHNRNNNNDFINKSKNNGFINKNNNIKNDDNNIHKNNTSKNQGLLQEAFEMSYDKFLHKRLLCFIRQKLGSEAESAAIKSFSRNLSQLLLEQPVRDRAIMGMDPGFTNGCKYAVINKNGEVVATGKAFLTTNASAHHAYSEAIKIREVLISNNCELVAIGDGQGCRQTEQFFDLHIKKGVFHPLHVVFCIAREAGASVYSASKLADQELSDMDITLRGAVSIARRTQDPLVELIKIDPKHLGVGMYQHDITNSKLHTALSGVVEDCVSFVGVDVNVCGAHLLQHVAGIGPSLAKKIVAKRGDLGGFESRQQLMLVSGLGNKTFTQCAGFLRIIAKDTNNAGGSSDNNGITKINNSGSNTSNDDSSNVPSSSALPALRKRKGVVVKGVGAKKAKATETNCLDRTSVHPEAYLYADNMIEKAKLRKSGIGSQAFVEDIKKFYLKSDIATLATDMSTSVESLQQILESLSQVTEFDIRAAFGKPLVRQSIQRLADLKVGDVLNGKVMNLTDFGAFVDVGVEREGLIHVSQLPNRGTFMKSSSGGYGAGVVNLGDLVTVYVLNVDVKSRRIGLKLCAVNNNNINDVNNNNR